VVLYSGVVTPDGALLLASGIYIAVLIVACGLSSALLRFIIAMSAGATLIYTPVLKRMMVAKNLTVAFIIAASPLTGALAASGVRFFCGFWQNKCLWMIAIYGG
jgi:4-hydroxybenzoate polyprenyltransferase